MQADIRVFVRNLDSAVGRDIALELDLTVDLVRHRGGLTVVVGDATADAAGRSGGWFRWGGRLEIQIAPTTVFSVVEGNCATLE